MDNLAIYFLICQQNSKNNSILFLFLSVSSDVMNVIILNFYFAAKQTQQMVK